MQLVIIQGDRQIKTPLDEGKALVVGRHKDSDIRVNDASISRKHLTVEVRGQNLYIQDLNSRNGFKVNGKRQSEITLNHNDGFSVGDVEFIFQTHDDPHVLNATGSYDDEVTPVDAEFVPVSPTNSVSTDTPVGQPAVVSAVTPVSPAPSPSNAVVPVGTTTPAAAGTPKAEGTLSDEEKKKKMLKIAIPAVAGFFVLLIGILAMMPPPDNGGPQTGQDNPKSSQNSQVGNSENNSGLEEGGYLDLCNKSIEKFMIYFKKPKADTVPLEEASEILIKASAIAPKRYEAHIDLETIYNTFKSVNNEFSNFTQKEIKRVFNASSDITDYRDSRTTAQIKAFSELMYSWAQKQNDAYRKILSDADSSLKSLYNTDTISAHEKALANCDDLKKGGHIFVKRVEEYEVKIRAELGKQYHKLFQRESDVSKKEEYIREAIIHDESYKKVLQDFLKAEAAKKGLAEQYKLFTQYVADEEHKEVVKEAEKLFGTKHQVEAKKAHTYSSRMILIRELRTLYEKKNIVDMEDKAKSSKFKTDAKILALVSKYKKISENFEKAQKFLEKENYEEAKNFFNKVIDAEFNPDNAYRTEAENIVSTELTDSKIAEKHYAKGKQIFNNGDVAKIFYIDARAQFKIAEKYQPGISKNQVTIMIEKADEECDDFIKVFYKENRPSDEELQVYIKGINTCLKFLDPDSSNPKEKKVYDRLTTALKEYKKSKK